LFPWRLCSWKRRYSSALLHPRFSMPGSKWLCHLHMHQNTSSGTACPSAACPPFLWLAAPRSLPNFWSRVLAPAPRWPCLPEWVRGYLFGPYSSRIHLLINGLRIKQANM
jgi:hypothetical protein